MLSREILWVCAFEVEALKCSLWLKCCSKTWLHHNIVKLIFSAMSLNCFWCLSRHCASTSLWIVLKNSATSTAACESSSFYSAQTCKFSENFSNRHSSCIGKAMSPVSCYQVVCRLYSSFNPYAASLLLYRKSQFSSEESKHPQLAVWQITPPHTSNQEEF